MTASMLETCRNATIDHIIENGIGYGKHCNLLLYLKIHS